MARLVVSRILSENRRGIGGMAAITQRSRGGCCNHCVMVLLALANRVLFQVGQVGRPSPRILATGVRAGYCQTSSGRQYGLCHGLGNSLPEAAELRTFLIKFSGRQMRHNQVFTNPALLAGLWIFLSLLEITQAYSQEALDKLKATAQQFSGSVV